MLGNIRSGHDRLGSTYVTYHSDTYSNCFIRAKKNKRTAYKILSKIQYKTIRYKKKISNGSEFIGTHAICITKFAKCDHQKHG